MDERRKGSENDSKRPRSSRHDVQPPTSSSGSEWASQGYHSPYYRSRSPEYTPQNWPEPVYSPQYIGDFTNAPPYNSHSDSLQPFGLPSNAFPQAGQCPSQSCARPDSGNMPKAAQKHTASSNPVQPNGAVRSSTQNSGGSGSFSEYYGGYRSSPQYIGGSHGYPEQQSGSPGYANRPSTLQVPTNRECATPGYTNKECGAPVYTHQDNRSPVYPHQECGAPVYYNQECGASVYNSQQGRAAGYNNQQGRTDGYSNQQCSGATGYSNQQYYGTGCNNRQYGCSSQGGGKIETGGQQDKGNGSANGTPHYFGGQRDFIQPCVNLHQSGGLSGNVSHSLGGYGNLSDSSANTSNPLLFFNGSQQEPPQPESIHTNRYAPDQDRESQATPFGFPGWSGRIYQELGSQSPRFATENNDATALDYPGMPPTPPYQADNSCAHDAHSACYCSVHHTNRLHHDDSAPLDLDNLPPLDVEDILLTQRFLSLGSASKKIEGA